MVFICICNPVDVWDHDAFFEGSPKVGYWVFPKTLFDRVCVGDRLFLRVTSKGKLPGIVAAFTATGRRTGDCPTDFWRVGRHPQGLQYLVDFNIDAIFQNKRITVEDLKMSPIHKSSPLLRVPQQMAAALSDEDAEILEGLIRKRSPLGV